MASRAADLIVARPQSGFYVCSDLPEPPGAGLIRDRAGAWRNSTVAPEIPWQTHLAAYEQAPHGDKYVVLDGVDHGFGGMIYDPIMFAFGDQRRQLDETIRLSLLFMNAFGGNDAHSRSELDSAIGKTGFARLDRK